MRKQVRRRWMYIYRNVYKKRVGCERDFTPRWLFYCLMPRIWEGVDNLLDRLCVRQPVFSIAGDLLGAEAKWISDFREWRYPGGKIYAGFIFGRV